MRMMWCAACHACYQGSPVAESVRMAPMHKVWQSRTTLFEHAFFAAMLLHLMHVSTLLEES
jgi:hypothetical protein